MFHNIMLPLVFMIFATFGKLQMFLGAYKYCKRLLMGGNTLKVNDFCSKKVIYNKYYSMQWAKILMSSFGYPKHKQIFFDFAQQHFGIQNYLWIKINLDPTVRWRRLDKINVHGVYHLLFFNGHRASSLWFMKHYQTKENWKKYNAHL
jgi:hypothetical protein